MLPLARFVVRALIVVLMLGISTSAWSAESSAVEKAAASHYEQGTKFFEAENFAAARVEFEAAYNLTKQPDLLYNIALSFEREGLAREALAGYRRYLAAKPDEATQQKVAKLAAQLEPSQAALTSAPPVTQPAEKKRSGARIASYVLLGAGAAITVVGCALLGVTASQARSIESQPRNSTDLQLALDQRARMESASIALLVIGPLTAVGGGLALRWTK